ncbi:hypothetical protein O181_059371 [Austropuccinia psidii MF-1]|uniref:Uncharacterized protein n=1 Tax=Austropuccinia psidii MF-1 TaxID=1389203 RepID=A0A9Q3HVM4_9BASI|nr:hypothetical protein [Austropuccinia psidii MF-1]
MFGPSQQLQVTELMASIDGKEKYDAFNRRMKEKPTETQTDAITSPSGQQQLFKCEKAATRSEQGKWQSTSQGYRIPKIQQDAMENLFQMARTMIELSRKEEARLKYQKLFLTF